MYYLVCTILEGFFTMKSKYHGRGYDEKSTNDLPSYGMEAIISTIDDEEELIGAFRIECENQRKNLNYLNEQTGTSGITNNRKKNNNIVKLTRISNNISMD